MTTNPIYDVLVAGGGPAGIVAATQAARAGARTLLVEKSGILGGTTTLNGVNLPGLFHAWGRQVIAGPGWELIEKTVRESGGALPDFGDWRAQPHWKLQIPVNVAVYAALADHMVMDAGATLRLHTMPASVAYDGDEWKIQLCGKEGLSSLRATVLVDCTGDANLVAQAGLPLARNEHLQPGTLITHAGGYELERLDLDALEAAFAREVSAGRMPRSDFQAAREPVGSFLRMQGGNAMHVPDVDGSTSQGKTRAELKAREALLRIVRFLRSQPGMEGFRINFMASECGIRETRTIEGEHRLTRDEYVGGRVWEDSLCYSFYPIDLHAAAGGGIDTRPLREGVVPTIPLRAQLPKGSRRLIVAGRSACGDREANSAFRVQASAMAMGQVAGAVAALAARTGRELREVPLHDIRTLLRQHGAVVPGLVPA